MNEPKKNIEVKVERTILASPGEAFDAWLDPKVPGNPWNMAEKLLLNPHVDGFFYWLMRGTAHYGRFTEVERPGRIQHTWMSRSTSGEESTVNLAELGTSDVLRQKAPSQLTLTRHQKTSNCSSVR
jgi:uncharacterized protein YndB with AHSA1/START domain